MRKSNEVLTDLLKIIKGSALADLANINQARVSQMKNDSADVNRLVNLRKIKKGLDIINSKTAVIAEEINSIIALGLEKENEYKKNI